MKKHSKGFTVIELMIAFMVICILAVSVASGGNSYLLRAKAGEAVLGVGKIVGGELEYFSKRSTYLQAGPTNVPPVGTATRVNFEADPNWKLINFGFPGDIYFGYEAELVSATEANAKAYGDLNTNGVTSLYQRSLSVDADGKPIASQLFTFDELE